VERSRAAALALFEIDSSRAACCSHNPLNAAARFSGDSPAINEGSDSSCSTLVARRDDSGGGVVDTFGALEESRTGLVEAQPSPAHPIAIERLHGSSWERSRVFTMRHVICHHAVRSGCNAFVVTSAMGCRRARNKMPLRCGWLQAPLTPSSTTKVLKVPQKALIRACLVCIHLSAALAKSRLEIPFVTRSKEAHRCPVLIDVQTFARGDHMTIVTQTKETKTGEVPVDSPEQAAFTLLVKTAARLEAELNRVFRPLDLTGATYNILRILDVAGTNGRSCGDISEQLIAEVPDMTRLLDRLERLGYVLRERSNIDRRMVKVTITDKGRAVLDSLKEPVASCHKRQFSELSEPQLLELQNLLHMILKQVPGEGAGVAISAVAMEKHPPH